MYSKIKPYIPWDIVEFGFFIGLFMLANRCLFDSRDISYATMVAGCALYISICNRRQLNNQ